MDEFIKTNFIAMENWAKQIIYSIHSLRGYCDANEHYSDIFTSQSLPYQNIIKNNVIQEIISSPPIEIIPIDNIIKEVEKMIIELKIKGSVREHRNGLIKFTSTVFGCIYGRTKEEIREKLEEKITRLNKMPNKDKVAKKKVPLLSEFYQENFLPYKKNQGVSQSSIKGYE